MNLGYEELKEKLNKVLTGTSVKGTVETFTPKKKEVETLCTEKKGAFIYASNFSPKKHSSTHS